MDILIKRLDPDLPTPQYAHEGDAGIDLFAREAAVLQPGERRLIGTGIAVAIPRGHAGFVLPRSGLALHSGVTVLNSPGLIDSGYRDEVGVVLVNLDPAENYSVARGDRIAQLLVLEVADIDLITVRNLPESERNLGGFGDSGR